MQRCTPLLRHCRPYCPLHSAGRKPVLTVFAEGCLSCMTLIYNA
jgi:hypothetical protein